MHWYQKDRAAGKLTHRKHAHMHMQPTLGINTELVEDLTKNFTWTLVPLAAESEGNDTLACPEAITDTELLEESDKLDKERESLPSMVIPQPM